MFINMHTGGGVTSSACVFVQAILKVIQDTKNKLKSLKKDDSVSVSGGHDVVSICRVWCDVCMYATHSQLYLCY